MLPHLIGLGFLVGWVFPFRSLPIFSFHQEWGACLFLLIAYSAIVFKKFSEKQGVAHSFLRTRKITVIAAAIPAFGVLQVVTGNHPLPITVGLFFLAFLAFSLAVEVGYSFALARNCCDSNQKFEADFTILCKWMLFGAFASAVMVFLQVLNWDEYFFPFIRSPNLIASRPSANLSQPNLMTLQLVFGITAAGWLYVKNKLHPWILISLILAIALAIIFANTRAYLLMLGAVAVGAWKYKGPGRSRLLIWSWLILPVVFLASLPFHNEIMQFFGHAGRQPLSINPHSDARVQIWKASWEIAKQHPLMGVGLGAYSIGFFNIAEGPLGKAGATGNAHNFTLQWMAECGIFFGLIFSLFVAVWFMEKLTTKNQEPWKICCITWIGAALAHSFVEFPLWYFSFLIPIGVFCGMISTTEINSTELKNQIKWKVMKFSLILISSFSLAWSLIDFIDLKENYEDGITIGNSLTIEKMGLQNRVSLFQWHYNYGKFLTVRLNNENKMSAWILGDKAVRRFPFVGGLTRYANISAQLGKPEEATAALKVLHQMRPQAFNAFRMQNEDLCREVKIPDSPYCILRNIALTIR